MLTVLSLTFPIFAIILVGYLVVRFGPLTKQTMRALGDFTMTLTLPCAVFHAVASRDFSEVLNPNYLLTLTLAAFATQWLTWSALLVNGTGPKRRALAFLASATPNSAFLGYPILLAVIPDHAGAVLAMNLLIENLVLTPIGLLVLGRADVGEGRSKGLRLLGEILLSVIRRPLIIGLALGFLLVLFGISLPDAVMRSTDILGQAASPVALIVIGGSLFGLNLRGDIKLASLIAGVKLLLHPAMVVLMLTVLGGLGLVAMDRDLTIGLLLTACLPMFSIFAFFGQEAGYEGLASLSVLMGTLLSFVTLNIALIVLL